MHGASVGTIDQVREEFDKQTHAPKGKIEGQGKKYLFSIDGFSINAIGVTVGSSRDR